MKFRSYDQALKRGSFDVWPGCGRSGRCRPCGRIHNFDYRTHQNGPWISEYECTTNRRNGCPRPKPPPVHDFSRTGKCSLCGTIDPRRQAAGRLTKAQVELLRLAAANGNERTHGEVPLWGKLWQPARVLSEGRAGDDRMGRIVGKRLGRPRFEILIAGVLAVRHLDEMDAKEKAARAARYKGT